jgi:hypothetical protein
MGGEGGTTIEFGLGKGFSLGDSPELLRRPNQPLEFEVRDVAIDTFD